MDSKKKFYSLLLVTDQPPVAFWLKKQLDPTYALIEAQGEKETLEILRYTPLDLILIDDNMENIDTFALCRSIRATSLIPILLITGKLKKHYLEEAKKAGITDFLNDQLHREDLLGKIKVLLKL